MRDGQSILVTGGAGYIGSHFVQLLKQQGLNHVVIDNLSRGHRHFVFPENLIVGDVGDFGLVRRVCEEYCVDVAVHFAAFAYVEESVENPALYYNNNIVKSVTFLEALRNSQVRKIVFSSSCATYGIPHNAGRILETIDQKPINPYGFTKLVVERLLADYDVAYGIRSVCLRYFNAAGANPERGLYEAHEPETHFIPRAVSAALGGGLLRVNGRDYSTRDGTCERDYVHVDDLAVAHLEAVKLLRSGNASDRINLGIGRGYTLLEVIAATERVTRRTIAVEFGPRRPGDPPVLVADPSRARSLLSWQPRYTDIDEIVATAVEGSQRYLSARETSK